MPFYYSHSLYFLRLWNRTRVKQIEVSLRGHTHTHTPRAVYDIVSKILNFEMPKSRDVSLVGTAIASQVQYVQLLVQLQYLI